MNDINQIILEGKCTGEKSVCNTAARFSVATLRNGETSEFIVHAFGGLARFTGENIKNGKRIRIVGRLCRNKWPDKTGKKKAETHIVAEHIEFMKDK